MRRIAWLFAIACVLASQTALADQINLKMATA